MHTCAYFLNLSFTDVRDEFDFNVRGCVLTIIVFNLTLALVQCYEDEIALRCTLKMLFVIIIIIVMSQQENLLNITSPSQHLVNFTLFLGSGHEVLQRLWGRLVVRKANMGVCNTNNTDNVRGGEMR